MRESGTSVPTETCGQSMPLKFRITFWEYWIWSEVTLSWRGWVTAEGGVTKNTGAGPGTPGVSARIASGGWPGVQAGTGMVCWTVSIQKKEAICGIWAFGSLMLWLPSRKAMSSVPPLNSGLLTLVASPRTVFGSSRMAWVMVPFLMNRVRSCGIRAVFELLAVWLANRPMLGVMLTGGIEGGPLNVRNVPCALSVVPCGIEAIRTRVFPSGGSVVAGTFIHTPGSKWMPMGFAGSVMSLTVSR